MIGFAMWTGAFILAGAEVCRIAGRILEQGREDKQTVNPGPTDRRRVVRFNRGGQVDLTITDLRGKEA